MGVRTNDPRAACAAYRLGGDAQARLKVQVPCSQATKRASTLSFTRRPPSTDEASAA